MTTLLLKQNDIPELTSFDGNIDADKLKPYIFLAQKTEVKKALGAELYTKIYNDYVAETLAGVYETIYNEYVVDMLVYFSCSKYMNFGGVKVSNNGNFRVAFSGAVSLSEKETDKQVALYDQMAESVVTSFYEYMAADGTPATPEYKTDTNDKTENRVIPWY